MTDWSPPPEAADSIIAMLEAERALADDLYATLKEAREDMAAWAAYASEYFQEKWHLDADLARCDDALARYREARGR